MTPHAQQLDAALLDTGIGHPDHAFLIGGASGVRGVYNTFEFVLRLSEPVHVHLASAPQGISSEKLTFEQIEAASTYLHETIHWWQHVGSTYGLVLSMTYPAEAHATYNRLKELTSLVGASKPIRTLSMKLAGPPLPGTSAALANQIVNDQFDFDAYRCFTLNRAAREQIVQIPQFESAGHTFMVTYGNVVHLLATVADPTYQVLPKPSGWNGEINALREARADGFYHRSPVRIHPLGAREIMEGQARFAQLQYLHFASGKRLDWDEFQQRGLMRGVYINAFELFTTLAALAWPDRIDHPSVALFLLVCDMAINPGAGFPFTVDRPDRLISDLDPAERFVRLAEAVRTSCPEVAEAISDYTFDEYALVSRTLADAAGVQSPLDIAREVTTWAERSEGFATLSREHATFEFDAVNLPLRVMLAHFQAFMTDKSDRPEFFCWPGAWMTGSRVSKEIEELFDRHGALFVNKLGNNGVFARQLGGRNQDAVQATFEHFFASVATYHLTRQWIVESGPFKYPFRWLVENAPEADMKKFADSNFLSAYGFSPDEVHILSQE